MKPAISLLVLLLSIRGQEGPGPRFGFGRGPALGFQTLDTDHDGIISAQEIAASPAALRKLDTNHDGQITEDEVRPPGREGARPEGGAIGPNPDELVQTLMAFDQNKDGKLSKAELPERMRGMFDRGDLDKDGFLTPDEIRKMALTQAGTTPEAGRGGRGPDGRNGPGGSMLRFDPIFLAIDTDHDGILSAAEIRAAPVALKALDKNNDGQITADEARPAFGPRTRQPF